MVLRRTGLVQDMMNMPYLVAADMKNKLAFYNLNTYTYVIF